MDEYTHPCFGADMSSSSSVMISCIIRKFPDLYQNFKVHFDSLFGDKDIVSDADRLFVSLLDLSNGIRSYKLFQYLVHSTNRVEELRDLARVYLKDPTTDNILDINICKMWLRYCGMTSVQDMIDIIRLLHRCNFHGLALTWRKRLETTLRS